MKITILCENLVGKLVGSGEHGFSAFIEMNEGNYLFDTGSGPSIVANSLVFNKDIRSVKKIFLSHGHFDHSGGLPEVLKLRSKVDVHIHPHVFLDRIAVHKENGEEKKRFVGIPYKKVYLESLGANFILNSDFIEVEKGIFLTGEVPRKTLFEKSDPRLFSEINGKIAPDIFLDDQSLILDTEKGLILILGCAHSGMINIIHHVIRKTGKENRKREIPCNPWWDPLRLLNPGTARRIHQGSQADGNRKDWRLPLHRHESGIQTSAGIRR